MKKSRSDVHGSWRRLVGGRGRVLLPARPDDPYDRHRRDRRRDGEGTDLLVAARVALAPRADAWTSTNRIVVEDARRAGSSAKSQPPRPPE